MLILVPTLHEAIRLFGPSVEKDLLHQKFSYQIISGVRTEVSLCGFGLASAGSGASFALTRYLQRNHQILPSRVILVGICGSFDPVEAPIGTALYGTTVYCYGIGIGEQESFESAENLGWLQGIPSSDGTQTADELELALPQSAYAMRGVSQGIRKGGILSVCAASSDVQQANQKRERYESILLEDMESFSVGLACQLWKTPLTVIRGVSNEVGIHDKSRWKFGPALEAVRDLLPTAINQIQVENLS